MEHFYLTIYLVDNFVCTLSNQERMILEFVMSVPIWNGGDNVFHEDDSFLVRIRITQVVQVTWYLYALSHKAFGRGDGQFWLDDVNCGGREYDIERCSRRDWGRHNCRSTNQAGVICKLHRSDVIYEPEPSSASGEV